MTRLIAEANLSNMFGPVNAEIRQRLTELLDNPRQHWDRDHGIILSGHGRMLTVWQAVIAVDPTFPNEGPAEDRAGRRLEDWRRYPDQMLIARAIKYAATVRPRSES